MKISGSSTQSTGARRAQAETTRKSAATGAYHRSASSMTRKITTSVRSHASVSQENTESPAPVSDHSSQMAKPSSSSPIAMAKTMSGTATSATTSFEATVSPSDTGSDFQKRMLR